MKNLKREVLMKTTRIPKSVLSRALLLVLGASSFQLWAADDAAPGPLLMWLFNLSDIALVTLVIAIAVLASLAVWTIRSLRANQAPGSDTQGLLKASALGVALGALFSWLLADAWQSYVMERLTTTPSTAAGAGGPPGAVRESLLEDPDEEGFALPVQAAKKIKSGHARHARVNFDALNAESLELNLFDDEILTAKRDRIVQNAQGASVWVGRVEGREDSEVILVAKGKTLMGTVLLGDRSFEITYVKGQTHAVRELDPKALPEKYEPEEMEQPSEADLTAGTGATETTQNISDAVTGQVIDLMVVYTTQSRVNAGGVAGIEGRIVNAVTKANQAYINSKIPMQLNLVKMVETNYVESGSMSTDKNRLQYKVDGYMDEIHPIRDQVGADQVVLINANTDVCGVASVMTTVSTSFAVAAFSAVHDDSVYDCLGTNNTLAHELGHNQGNMHDQASSTSPGAYPDSYGYRVCGVFRDIMAYSCQGEVRIPYFSSSDPTLTYAGQPIGVAGSADTARSMAATAPTVAAFRQAVSAPPTVPNTPASLTASALSSSAISLTWLDNATDETGYKVQRSSDGVNWLEIAALNANTTGFSDTSLQAQQTLSYRVLAWNSVGNSAFSNVSQATTQAEVPPPPPADTTAPTLSMTPASGATLQGTVSIVVNAQDNVAISKMTLAIDGKVVSTKLNPGATGNITYSWNTKKATVGSHTLTAVVTDSSNLVTNVTRTVNVTR